MKENNTFSIFVLINDSMRWFQRRQRSNRFSAHSSYDVLQCFVIGTGKTGNREM